MISCGATRLDASASTQRIPTYADFVNEESAPSPILTRRFSVCPRKSIQSCVLYRNPTACGSLLRIDKTYYSFSQVCPIIYHYETLLSTFFFKFTFITPDNSSIFMGLLRYSENPFSIYISLAPAMAFAVNAI